MAKIDWKSVWDKAVKSNDSFPTKVIKNKTVTVSCPTRFSNTGKFSIEVTPSFNDDSIVLELLVFNDNVVYDDLSKEDIKSKSTENDFNKLSTALLNYELSNRLMERFKIKSDGFESEKDAVLALIDYINNKATESGRMFDNKLDELNDIVNRKSESKTDAYKETLKSIRESRTYILRKVESILNKHYKWKIRANEDVSDSVTSLYDKDGNLAAVVAIDDDNIVVNLSQDIVSKINMIQSDEDIEAELVNDVDAAQEVLADKEIDQLKDVVAGNPEGEFNDEYDSPSEDNVDDYLDELSNRISKLESLYINRKFRNFK